MAAAATPFVTAFSGLPGRPQPNFSAIEAPTGGRIGVAALDMASGRTISHRGDERFAMCSTFKWLLAALVLNRVDLDEERLARRIIFTRDDLVTYSPVTEPHASQGGMTIGELCKATVSRSDNTAANFLIESLGGPSGFTARVRAFGDATTRLDRIEPQLNENAPGDPRDTSTPLSMLGLMRDFLFGSHLTEQSRTLLRDWMIETNTGLDRLRAGFPPNWIAGDKTGTSSNDANNDVAFAMPPTTEPTGWGPVIVVSFTNAPNPATRKANAVHASVASEVIRVFS